MLQVAMPNTDPAQYLIAMKYMQALPEMMGDVRHNRRQDEQHQFKPGMNERIIHVFVTR